MTVDTNHLPLSALIAFFLHTLTGLLQSPTALDGDAMGQPAGTHLVLQ